MRLFASAFASRSALVLCFAVCLSAPPAAAQNAETPTNIQATETPWTVTCRPAAGGATVDCQLDKQLNTANPVTLVSQVSVLTVDGKLSMRIIAPHQLAIADGLTLQIDGKDIGQRAFTTSLPAGIVALFPLDDDTLAEARKGQELKVIAKMNSGQSFTFGVSLVGFSASLAKVLQ